MDRDEAIQRVLVIPVGRKNAIKSHRLAELWNVSNSVQVRQIVNVLRNKHYPICSDKTGYWVSDDREEIMKCSLDLYRRAQAILKASRSLCLSDPIGKVGVRV